MHSPCYLFSFFLISPEVMTLELVEVVTEEEEEAVVVAAADVLQWQVELLVKELAVLCWQEVPLRHCSLNSL